MTNNTKDMRAKNFLLIALFMVTTIFTAFHEGYFPLISLLFGGLLVGGFLISIWLAFTISTKRLLGLILGIFMVEYIKETIGIRSGFWTYHGTNGFYNFGVWAWVLGGVTAYTLSTRVVIRLIRKLKFSLPRWLNPIIVILIAALIPMTLGKYWGGVDVLFVLFYILVLIASIYASTRMDFSVFVGIVITAWFVGNISEFLGSAKSGVWTFNHNPNYPPFFLLFGCWPLEILTQYLLSAIWANEPLDKDTF